MQLLNPRTLVFGLLLAVGCVLATIDMQPLWGQETADTPAQTATGAEPPASGTARQRPRGRLPAYYTRVVSDEQREQIYKIQQGYEPKIKELMVRIEKLQQQRDKEIEEVLTPEQLERVHQLREEARQRRQQRQQQNQAQSDEANAESP